MNISYNIRTIIAFIIGLIIVLTLQNCERDDICAESTLTTPRLLIEFYNASSTDDLLNVSRLTAYGEGIVTDPTIETDEDLLIVFNTNINVIEVPLIIGAEGNPITTRYVLEKDTNLRLDSDSSTNSNIDTIDIAYTTQFIYVSRACGYKSIFNELDVQVENDGDIWISNIEVVAETIENENTVHVKIYH